MRLLDIACGPFARGCQFCLEGLGLVVPGAYLVVGHVFFDDHFDVRGEGYSRCWYDKNALEGTG